MTASSIFSKAAVAAPHALAVQCGRACLDAGFDAIEAMVAMAAAIAVVYPHMNSIGGDGVWLIKEPSGRLHCIDGCGFAGATATIEAYRAAGYEAIPTRGPMSALTVPGAVGGWTLALELSRSLGGRAPLTDLLGPALRAAKEGYRVSPGEARVQPREAAALFEAPGFAQTFLIEGRPPKAGETRRPSALGETLDYLAHAGLADFYRGDVAREMAAEASRIDAPIGRSDFMAYRALIREPLTLALPRVLLANAPPPTQGLGALLMLGYFDRLQVRAPESFEHVHGLVEAAKLAVAIRDRVCVDFDGAEKAAGAHLTADAIGRRAQKISMTRAARFSGAPDAGDTVWMGAVDSRGMAVSYIQSVFWEYGSGCVLTGAGVHLHNRGASFSLDPDAPNALAPGRRPFHTLSPALAQFANGDALVYGSMGGEGQPQFQAQILTRMAFGDGPAEAIERPRFLLGRNWGRPSATLKLEPRFDPSLIAALERAGHEVELLSEPYADLCGHAGAVLLRANGTLAAAHDPRADGGADGL